MNILKDASVIIIVDHPHMYIRQVVGELRQRKVEFTCVHSTKRDYRNSESLHITMKAVFILKLSND